MSLIRIFILMTSTLVLSGCFFLDTKKKLHLLEGNVFGSYFKIKYLVSDDFKRHEELQKNVQTYFDEFDKKFSHYRDDSWISIFNKSSKLETTYPLELPLMLKVAKEVHDHSQGLYDVTILPLVELWGFGPVKNKEAKPSKIEIDLCLQTIGFSRLILDQEKKKLIKKETGVKIDFNSLAPGFVADQLALILEKFLIKDFMVDIGGEITARGLNPQDRPWTIGIETPSATSKNSLQAKVQLNNFSIATSGNYRQFVESKGKIISHIFNPLTGESSPSEVVSVTVLAPSAALADAWATAIMILGPKAFEKGSQLDEYFLKRKIGLYVLLKEQNNEVKIMTNGPMIGYLVK